ncbi:hypothetical protein LSCM1_04546 [Leishmania martiniquensis]|uniref:Uncharacterized protein n=1 Tax=Leishmania martiniquensis TaxID=1580590 RepID=A0A836GF82_9TRYP|nr:hypothetical protein LSCM1_04546 [Leishmania martiniquensis]
MHRNRIRVRPAGNSNGSSGTRSMPHIDFNGADESFRDLRAAAPRSAESALATPSSHSWDAQSSSALYDANASGEGWRYVRRIASLAYDTVSGVLDVLRARTDGEASASKDNYPPVKALSSPMAPPNTPQLPSATLAQSCAVARQRCSEAHVADTVELRQSRRSAFSHQLPPPHVTVSERAPQARDPPPMPPPVREAPQCQITVNQYFAAPERSIYPLVFANLDQATTCRVSPASQPRVSLLAAPSSVTDHAKRPRLAAPAAPTESRERKAQKRTAYTDAPQACLGGAPSAIQAGSQENPSTVPIMPRAPARLSGKADAPNGDVGTAPAKSAVSLADTPAPRAPLFGGATTTPAATAAPNAFVFGSKPAAAAPKHSGRAATAPAFGAAKASSFVKPGPPAVISDDSGFAPNADSDDERGTKTSSESAAPAKAPFSFSPIGAKPTFGATSSLSTGAPANPFSFSAKTAEASPASTAPAFGAAKASSFVKPGPPAVISDDSGFAPNADSDDERGTKTSSESAAPAKAPFSFSPIGAKPTFGATSSLSTGAPANPFSFSAKTAEASPASTAPAFGAAKASSFVKPGPPAVISDDSGFAPNADSDDERGTKTSSESAAPAKAPFSFSPIGAKPTFGATSSLSTGAPANPFSFSAKTAEASPASTAPAFGAAKASSFVKLGPPAVISDDSGFAPNADSDDKGHDREAKADSSATGGGSGAFSFRLNAAGAKPPLGRQFAFGGASPFGATASASETAAKPFPTNPRSTGPLGTPSNLSFTFPSLKQ